MGMLYFPGGALNLKISRSQHLHASWYLCFSLPQHPVLPLLPLPLSSPMSPPPLLLPSPALPSLGDIHHHLPKAVHLPCSKARLSQGCPCVRKQSHSNSQFLEGLLYAFCAGQGMASPATLTATLPVSYYICISQVRDRLREAPSLLQCDRTSGC